MVIFVKSLLKSIFASIETFFNSSKISKNLNRILLCDVHLVLQSNGNVKLLYFFSFLIFLHGCYATLFFCVSCQVLFFNKIFLCVQRAIEIFKLFFTIKENYNKTVVTFIIKNSIDKKHKFACVVCRHAQRSLSLLVLDSQSLCHHRVRWFR